MAIIMTVFCGSLVFGGSDVRAQHVDGAQPATGVQPPTGVQLTTEERLQTEAWWPTKLTLPLSGFAGSGACTGCHGDESPARPSAMMRAATPAADSHFLPPGTRLHSDAQPLTYYLDATAGGGLALTTTGANGRAQKLDWVMGDGVLGRTFLYQADGRWFQSEVTYYTNDHALDVTTGLSHDGSLSALGQVLTPDETRRCFACHTVHATTSAGFNPLHAEAGLGCEACHGPGQAHVTAARSTGARSTGARSTGAPGPAMRAAIFNPAKLSPADSNDFCGSCHRTFSDATIATAGITTSAVVRFQPYRLEESKCWRATEDERLTCVACHNPHEALDRDPASYDRKCVSCHQAPKGAAHLAAASRAAAPQTSAPRAAVCPKSTGQCTTCHMPKVKVPSMHGDFTDHDIRIVRPGEAMPS